MIEIKNVSRILFISLILSTFVFAGSLSFDSTTGILQVDGSINMTGNITGVVYQQATTTNFTGVVYIPLGIEFLQTGTLNDLDGIVFKTGGYITDAGEINATDGKFSNSLTVDGDFNVTGNIYGTKPLDIVIPQSGLSNDAALTLQHGGTAITGTEQTAIFDGEFQMTATGSDNIDSSPYGITLNMVSNASADSGSVTVASTGLNIDLTEDHSSTSGGLFDGDMTVLNLNFNGVNQNTSITKYLLRGRVEGSDNAYNIYTSGGTYSNLEPTGNHLIIKNNPTSYTYAILHGAVNSTTADYSGSNAFSVTAGYNTSGANVGLFNLHTYSMGAGETPSSVVAAYYGSSDDNAGSYPIGFTAAPIQSESGGVTVAFTAVGGSLGGAADWDYVYTTANQDLSLAPLQLSPGNGREILIYGGDAFVSGTGGNINISLGAGASAADGSFNINDASGNNLLQVNTAISKFSNTVETPVLNITNGSYHIESRFDTTKNSMGIIIGGDNEPLNDRNFFLTSYNASNLPSWTGMNASKYFTITEDVVLDYNYAYDGSIVEMAVVSTNAAGAQSVPKGDAYFWARSVDSTRGNIHILPQANNGLGLVTVNGNFNVSGNITLSGTDGYRAENNINFYGGVGNAGNDYFNLWGSHRYGDNNAMVSIIDGADNAATRGTVIWLYAANGTDNSIASDYGGITQYGVESSNKKLGLWLGTGTTNITLSPATDVVVIDDVLDLIPRASAPAAPLEGMMYADTSHALCYYNSTHWENLGVSGACA